MPISSGRRHSHRKLKSSNAGASSGAANQTSRDDERPATPPAQRVQFILGEDVDVDDVRRISHPLFSEMEELVRSPSASGDSGELEWKETARWVKFEEDVEEGGNRWSKPHVATLSLHSLFELRSLLNSGTVMLDMEATNLEEVTALLCDSLYGSGSVTVEVRMRLHDVLLRRHRHQHEAGQHERRHRRGDCATPMSRLPIIRSLADIGRNYSSTKSECWGEARGGVWWFG